MTMKKVITIGVSLILAFFIAVVSVMASNTYAYADTAKTTTTSASVTGYFTGTGSIIMPNTTFSNPTKYDVTLDSVTSPQGYSFTKDWTNDATGKTVSAGNSLSVKWTCASKVTSAFAEEAISAGSKYVGDIVYTYSYTIPDLPGSATINGTKAAYETLTANVSDTPSGTTLNYVWYRGDSEGALTTKVGTGATYTVQEADDLKYLTCVITDASGYYGSSISASCYIESPKTAFAVYSATDNSLNFYKRLAKQVPTAGDTFDGRTATAVYTGIESDTYGSSTVPWVSYQGSIKTASVVDSGIQPVSTAYWFYGCTALTSVTGLDKLDTSAVTNMSSMFSSCSSLTSVGDLSGWDTSKVTSMPIMFSGCKFLTSLDSISGWNTSAVTDMGWMFNGCTSLTSLDLSNWNTSAVTDMSWMFSSCYKLTSVGDLSDWNTSKVTDMSNMFKSCFKLTSLESISGWDTNAVETMRSMFYTCRSLTSVGDLSDWNTSSVTNMYGMFMSCTSLTSVGNLSQWTTSKVTSMGSMFSNCESLTSVGDLSDWNTSAVTNMSSMFSSCSSLTSLNLSDWNTSAVTSMTSMFSNCESLTSLDLSNWDTSAVTTMKQIFNNMNLLQQITFGENWKWVGTDGYLPTPSSTYITGADGKWYNTNGDGYDPSGIPSNVADTYTAIPPAKTAFAVYSETDNSLNFYKRVTVPTAGDTFDDRTATAVYTGIDTATYSWNTVPWKSYQSSITTSTVVDSGIQPVSTACWFYGCSVLTTITGFDKLDTSKVTDMYAMFCNCKSLTSIDDLSGWTTSAVDNMASMFFNCNSLTTLDSISGWDTSKVTSMQSMFSSCSKLTSLDLSKWTTSAVTNMQSIFNGCTSLTTLDLSNWDTSKVTSMGWMFDEMNLLQQITFGENWKWVGTNGYLPTPSSTYITGADGKWYNTNGDGFDASGIPSNVADTYTAIPPAKTAFAVYSETDNSLNFYKRVAVPTAGDTFDGRTATAVYTGIESDTYSYGTTPWSGYQSSITTSTVVDSGIQPVSTACWFWNCSKLTSLTNLDKLDTSKVTDMNNIFSNCYSLTTVGDLSNWDTGAVTDMGDMFYNCKSLTSVGDLSGWDTSAVTNMSFMFRLCQSLTSVGDLSGWDTGAVTKMNCMFYDCSALTSLDLSGWDTGAVTNMYGMFYNCSNLTSVDLSEWTTSAVTSMGSMFYGCSALTTVSGLEKLDTSAVTNMSSMFNNCSKLTANCSGWNVNKVTSHTNFNINASGVKAPTWVS